MKNKVLLFSVSLFLAHAGLFAQSIYTEVGFNTLGKVDYTNIDKIDFKSESILLPQKHIEIGLQGQVSQSLVLSMGLSSNAYNFTNNLYLSIDTTTSDHVHVKSLFELGYLGGNLGVDLLLVDNDQWRIFTSGKLSGNFLDRGVRTDKVIDADPSIFPKLNSNLMIDDHFQKLWFTIQYGFGLSYKVSSSMAFYTRYNFNQSLTTIKNDEESYDFNSHNFSVGLTFNIRAQDREDMEQLSENHPLKKDEETKSTIDQTDVDLSLKLGDKLQVEDSTFLKIYFPSNSTDFYENHTEELEQLAELLLKDRSIRYDIIGYHQALTEKNESIVRLRAVFDFLSERGVLREQLIIAYKEEQTQDTPEKIWSRRVELIKKNNK